VIILDRVSPSAVTSQLLEHHKLMKKGQIAGLPIFLPAMALNGCSGGIISR